MIKNKGETIKKIATKGTKANLPKVEIGDTVKMKVRVQEGEKTRLHPFEGTVIAKKGSGIHATMTIRKVSFGEGVERIFPVNSPVIESLTVVSQGKTQRSKLYYLRGRTGRKATLSKKESVTK
ncbi:MAG: 50S ribosomal protein L19 [Candidatus Omnitrophica bacterium]|nr:50S ribosomal protein L19 [Candidatus Omnitrophota bacterium]